MNLTEAEIRFLRHLATWAQSGIPWVLADDAARATGLPPDQLSAMVQKMERCKVVAKPKFTTSGQLAGFAPTPLAVDLLRQHETAAAGNVDLIDQAVVWRRQHKALAAAIVVLLAVPCLNAAWELLAKVFGLFGLLLR